MPSKVGSRVAWAQVETTFLQKNITMRPIKWLCVFATMSLLAFLALSGCAKASGQGQQPLTPVTSVAAKQPVQGLVDMQDTSFYHKGIPASFTLANVEKYPGQFGGIVLNVTWAQLQPVQPVAPATAGNSPIQTQYIDSSLEQVREYNSSNPERPLGVKLRVWGGFDAPEWAKNLDGAPVVIIPPPNRGANAEIGRYWTADYRQAWRDLQSALAERYDQEPLIREVAVTSCSWSTDEPFVQWIAPDTDNSGVINPNFTALQQAGYSAAGEIKCLANAIADYVAWKTTYLDFPFNSLEMYLPQAHLPEGPIANCQKAIYPGANGDLRFCNFEDPAKAIMIQCWQSGRCILSNQALDKGGPMNGSQSVFPYNFIDTLYAIDPAIKADYQTAGVPYVGTPSQFCDAVTDAKAYHASSVELWPMGGDTPGFTSLTLAQITALANVMDGTGTCAAGM